ncbi:MAG: hypothetical protein DRJ67_04130 [Thermoprotei archaeon]|nr:MAG: hypothetical protein DRJ67_04130 [Thermoprotei archaeon]
MRLEFADEVEAARFWIYTCFDFIPWDLLARGDNVSEHVVALAPEDAELPTIFNYVLFPRNRLDEEWIRENAQLIHEKTGMIVVEDEELGVGLAIDGWGYDFARTHYLALYRLRGLRWHERTLTAFPV